jgi:hypothetical protein
VEKRLVDISEEDFHALSSKDEVKTALKQLIASGYHPSYAWLRSTCGQDKNLWTELGRGTAVLDTVDHLNQYLYSYGPMISSQWRAILDLVPSFDRPIRLVDYGCGQGLAGLLLFDKFGGKLVKQLAKIVLIEPSPCALVRAEAVYGAIAPGVPIFCVNRRFDDVQMDDLVPEDGLASVHIFSNVLDITGFDQFALLSKSLTPGRHTILAVSHDRDFDGGSERIHALKKAVDDANCSKWLTVESSEIATFKCEGGKPAISWVAQLDMTNA